MTDTAIAHHGILGMKWGVRRSKDQLGQLSRQDKKWARKNSDKITKKATKKTSKQMSKYASELARDPNSLNKNGKLSSSTMTKYNNRMAELMNERVSDIRSPSGKTVKFVSKRGQIGVHMALADQGYNMDQLKNGVFESGKIAYKNKVVDKVESERRR